MTQAGRQQGVPGRQATMSGTAIASSRHSVGAQHKTWHRLCSKRFQGIKEQRKTEEQGFQHFACTKNGASTKERGGEGGPSFTRSIFSVVILCSQTLWKHLLCRLNMVLHFSLFSLSFFYAVPQLAMPGRG